jgi:acetate---CoA ligase (ADP-forming) subunit beta
MDLLPQQATLGLLAKYKIPYTESNIYGSKEKLFSANPSYPVVLKILSKDIVHKSDSGAVMTGIGDIDEMKTRLEAAEAKIRMQYKDAKLEYMLQKQEKGKEVIIGMKRDAQFGPVILFGLGGVFVEVFKDVCMRIAPLSRKDADEMIKSIKAYKILSGYRGEKPVNGQALAEIILKISELSMKEKDIQEIDFNPVMVNESYATVVDARMLR